MINDTLDNIVIETLSSRTQGVNSHQWSERAENCLQRLPKRCTEASKRGLYKVLVVSITRSEYYLRYNRFPTIHTLRGAAKMIVDRLTEKFGEKRVCVLRTGADDRGESIFGIFLSWYPPQKNVRIFSDSVETRSAMRMHRCLYGNSN